MKILTSGCSFTDNYYGPSWPERLAQLGHQVTNLGLTAAGNRYISDSVMNSLLYKKEKYDCVLIMWSGLLRLDFAIDADVIDMYPAFLHRSKKITENFSYASGAIFDQDAHPATLNIKKQLLLVTSDQARAYQSLLEIIKMQTFLKHNEIPYKFMSHVNFWNNNTRQDSPNLEIMNSLANLVENIDFSKFIFSNDNKDGLYEMAKNNPAYMSYDNFHPSLLGYQVWGDKVNNEILKGK
jgi:hypothetical protein